MSTRRDEDLEQFLRGDSELSRAYRRASAPLPRASLDRRILDRARATLARSGMPGSGSWAYAASVALAFAVIFAVAYAPRGIDRADDAPHFVRTATHGSNASGLNFMYPTIKGRSARPPLYSSDPPAARARSGADSGWADPHRWLARIAALREAGRDAEADEEYRRFRAAYPAYDFTRRETGVPVP